jgi:hypothetical protein
MPHTWHITIVHTHYIGSIVLYSTCISPACMHLFQVSFTTYVPGQEIRAPSKVPLVLVSQMCNGIEAHLQYLIPVFVIHTFILSLPPPLVILTDVSPWLLTYILSYLPTYLPTYRLAH